MATLQVSVKVGGTDYGIVSSFDPGVSSLDHVWFGAYLSGSSNNFQIRNIKVGTTGYGSSDLYAPALTSTSDFDSVVGSPSVSGGVLSVVNTGVDAYGIKSIGSQTDFYVQFDLNVDAAMLTEQSCDYHDAAIGTTQVEGLFNTSTPTWKTDDPNNAVFGAGPTASTWVTVDLHYHFVIATDFTIAASPATFTFDAVAGGSGTSTITVGEIGSSETVNLSLDTSGLPPWVTASLDVSSVTTPGTAHVSITATANVPAGSWNVTVNGSDSLSNTHSAVISVTTEVTGPVTPWDQSQPQQTVGTFPLQSGTSVSNDIWGGPFLLDHAGSLYLAWVENGDLNGPYVAVWTGSAWSVIGTGFETNGTALRTGTRLASDGTNLYLAYLVEQAQSVSNPCAAGTIQVVGYSARVWKYDGSTWTDLGTLASGSGPGDLPVTSMMGENGPGGGGIAHLKLSASPDEVGACYVALYEDGWVAASALGGHGGGPSCEAQRHLYVQGFGASTLGFVSLTSILLQPTGTDSPMFDYAMELCGSGANLTLYALQGNAYTGIPITGGVAHATYWKVWQRGGFLADLTLATAFGNTYYTLSSFQSTYLHVSDDQDGERILIARANYTDGLDTGTAQFARTSAVTAPETLGDLDGHWQLNGPINTEAIIVKQDNTHGDVWGYTTDVSQDGIVVQLADRCGVRAWELIQPYDYTSGATTFTQTAFELFQDALYAVNVQTPAVVKLPLCRGCGVCATGPGLHFWYRL